MKDLDTFIQQLERSIAHYGMESIGAEDILELATAVKKAIEESK